jgi:hypothetical protein
VVEEMVCGTILVNDNGNRYVPYLIWNGGKWQLNWNYLDNNFNRNYHFVRLRSSLFVLAEAILLFRWCGLSFQFT